MTPLSVKLVLALGLFGGSAMLINKTASNADADITVPAGFKSSAIIESLGRARHIAINSNGDIYVKMERFQK